MLGFAIRTAITALGLWLIVSATSWLASWVVGPKGRVEILRRAG